VNTECKALFAVASFLNSTVQFCKACVRAGPSRCGAQCKT